LTAANSTAAIAPTCEEASPNDAYDLEVSTITHSLGQTIQAIESAFLSAGALLSDTVDGMGDLIAGLDHVSAAVDQDMVASTTEDLKHASARLYEIPAALTKRRVGLESLIELGGALGASVSEMKRSLGYLRVFTVYVKIAAAGVREEGRQFTAFADEIAGCIAGGRAQVDAFDRDIEALDRTLRMALRMEGDLAIHCADLLPETPNAIVASASMLADHRIKVVQAVSAAMALAKGVRSKVGAVLAALQIGDSTRQRLEHVRDGLGLLESAVSELEDPPKARIRAIGLELLNALLASAGEDFDCEVQLIGRNMEGLAGDATEILTLLGAAYGRGGSGDEGILGRLQAHVSTAMGLVDEVHAADGAATDIGRSAAGAARQLIVRIDDIQRLQRDVQQMALNTRLKCSRIGADGQSLSVIALELRQQALFLEASAARATEHIDELGRGASLLTDAIDAPGDEGARGAAAALSQAVERLQTAGKTLQCDQKSLADLGSTVVQRLQRAASGVEIKAAVGAPLDVALHRMAGLTSVAEACEGDVVPVVTDFLRRLAKSYTMAPERNIHQVIAAALAVPQDEAPVAVEVVAAESLDDLLF
jgi:hypothetical protein